MNQQSSNALNTNKTLKHHNKIHTTLTALVLEKLAKSYHFYRFFYTHN